MEPVKDVRVKVYRYRCCHCKRVFRHDPEGSTSADQTERLRLFVVLLWRPGLSHRGCSLILSGLKGMVSHMSLWRDVQAEAGQVKKRQPWKGVRVLGLDGASVLGWGEKSKIPR